MRDYKIIHEQDQQIFYVNLEDDQKAYLKYQLLESRHIDFTSTLVPQTHRRQGLAAKLVDTGFAWADQQSLSIVASCWYAAKKLKERGLKADAM